MAKPYIFHLLHYLYLVFFVILDSNLPRHEFGEDGVSKGLESLNMNCINSNPREYRIDTMLE